MSSGDHIDGVPDQTQFNKPDGSDPIIREGHKPGLPVSETDNVPAFHGKTLPPGSAPKDQTFPPQGSDIPSQAANPDMGPETETSASDTLGGTTSGEVHRGLGQPIQGQTSAEIHHGGQRPGKKEEHGLVGKHPNIPSTSKLADQRQDERLRAWDKEEATPGRGDKGALAAEDLPPEQA
ncbi:MAG: hypothetical protein M1823_005630 [Watsoniomyces obsoletus]|nr:MAG: hypothetical protein M1823_005630 [Watsoniomyces obsoletus]